MRLINRLLKPFGVILLRRTSAKMLTESSNIVESYWNRQRATQLTDEELTRDLLGDDPLPPSTKLLITHLTNRPGSTVLWLRYAADQLHKGGDEYK